MSSGHSVSESEDSLAAGPPRATARPPRRLLFISYDFPPCTAPGALSCGEIAAYLPDYGWDPVVLSVKERHYRAVDRRRVPPASVIRTGKVPHPLEITDRLRTRLRGHGENRAATAGQGNGADAPSFTRAVRDLVLASLGTPDRQTGWIPSAVIAGLRACRQQAIKSLVSSGPCWTNHLVGLLIAQWTRLPWVAHFRDPWSHNPVSKDDGSLTLRSHAALERIVVTRADRVVCVTPRHTRLLQQLYPVSAEKFVTIPNGYDAAAWKEAWGGSLGPPKVDRTQFVITYTGSIDEERTPEPVFRAARRLVEDGEIDIERLRFDFVGWCEMVRGRRLEEVVAEHGLGGRVRIESPLMKVETFRRLGQSALLLLLAEGLTLQVPSKAYEYLRVGRPVLALAPADGAVADLFATTGGGWVVQPSDGPGIEAALRDAYVGWREGRDLWRPDPETLSRYDRASLAGRLAEVLDRVAS